MMKEADLEKRFYEGRSIVISDDVGVLSKPKDNGDSELDIIKLLRGTWVSHAAGWNLIALPASSKDLKNKPDSDKNNFRLLMNQYGETLKFDMPDTHVPNRGVKPEGDEPDQLINGITYEQFVVQKEVKDFPEGVDDGKRKVRAANGEPIHHEPGFFLQFLNHVQKGTSPDVTDENGKMVEKELKIARMGTIPHGNSVLAMGFVTNDKTIEDDDAFPERLKPDKAGKENKVDVNDVKKNPDLEPYLEPYRYFIENPFLGCVDDKKVSGFPGFSPDNTHAILQFTQNKLNVRKTTVLNFDTKFKVDGIDNPEFDHNDKPIAGFPISNVPFVKRAANVTEMHATFWIMELEKTDSCADPEFVMQYSQTVYLEFFDSPLGEKDKHGKPLRIRWPHVSINTLRKVGP